VAAEQQRIKWLGVASVAGLLWQLGQDPGMLAVWTEGKNVEEIRGALAEGEERRRVIYRVIGGFVGGFTGGNDSEHQA